LKDKIDDLAMNSKNKNNRNLYRGINEFERGYTRRTNLVKHENGDLLAGSHNILNSRKNFFSKLLNVHRVSEVRQIEIHITAPLVTEPTPVEAEIATAKLRKYKRLNTGQNPAELIREGSEILWSEMHKLINSNWHKKELPDQWNESIFVPNYKKGGKIDWSNYQSISLLSTSYKTVCNIFSQS
jgi:hypothetical protein